MANFILTVWDKRKDGGIDVFHFCMRDSLLEPSIEDKRFHKKHIFWVLQHFCLTPNNNKKYYESSINIMFPCNLSQYTEYENGVVNDIDFKTHACYHCIYCGNLWNCRKKYMILIYWKSKFLVIFNCFVFTLLYSFRDPLIIRKNLF